MTYSIKQFASLVGVTEHTLRYYEKEQLLQPSRLANGHRAFSEQDTEWIKFIVRLKDTGMPLKVIKQYAILRAKGDSTIKERKQLLEVHQAYVDKKLTEWQDHQHKLQQKIDDYHAMCLKKQFNNSEE